MKKIVFFVLTLLCMTQISFAATPEANCKRYFDGCNNCSRSVFGGEMACTMMACAKDQAPKCLEYFSASETQAPSKACTREYMPVCAQPPMPTCPDGMMCAQVMPALKTYGNKCSAEAENATIISEGECASTGEPGVSEGSVGGEDVKICTMEYAPVCGAKQVQCIKAPCYPITQTYGNKCGAEADGAKILYSGECVSSKIQSQIENGLTQALEKIPQEKLSYIVQRAIGRIDTLLEKGNLSVFKVSVLQFLKYTLEQR